MIDLPGYGFAKVSKVARENLMTLIEEYIENRGKINDDDFQKILDSQDRSKAGYSVPASGLFLTEINYKNIFKKRYQK